MGQTEPPVLHPVEDEAKDASSQEDSTDCQQEPAEVVLVAPDRQLVLQAGVDGDSALVNILRPGSGSDSELLKE